MDALLDPYTWILYTTSVLTTMIAAKRAIEVEIMLQKSDQIENVSITMQSAILFPIVGSVMLLIFFYFFPVASFLVFCSTLFSTIVSTSFTVVPILTYYFPETNFKEVTYGSCVRFDKF